MTVAALPVGATEADIEAKIAELITAVNAATAALAGGAGLATGLAALTGAVVIGGTTVTIDGQLVTDSILVTGIQASDGTIGTVWNDTNVLKVST